MQVLKKPILVHPRNARQLQGVLDQALADHELPWWVACGPRELAGIATQAEERLADLLGPRKTSRKGATIALAHPLTGSRRGQPVLFASLRRTRGGWLLVSLGIEENVEKTSRVWKLRLTQKQAATIAENASRPETRYKVSLDALPPTSPQVVAAVLLAASNSLKDDLSRARFHQVCRDLAVSAEDILDAVGRLQCSTPFDQIDAEVDLEEVVEAAYALDIERMEQRRRQEAVASGWAGVL